MKSYPEYLKRKCASIRSTVSHFGKVYSIYVVFIELMSLIVNFRSLTVMKLNMSNLFEKSQGLDEEYQCRRMNKDEVVRCSMDPCNERFHQFLSNEYCEGDDCFAVFDASKLVSYSWFCNRPYWISDELVFYHPSSMLHICLTYTDIALRGKHLSNVAIRTALHEYQKRRGVRDAVVLISADNVSSLRSFQKLGCERIGWVHILRLFSKTFFYVSSGCRNNGIYCRRAVRM